MKVESASRKRRAKFFERISTVWLEPPIGEINFRQNLNFHKDRRRPRSSCKNRDNFRKEIRWKFAVKCDIDRSDSSKREKTKISTRIRTFFCVHTSLWNFASCKSEKSNKIFYRQKQFCLFIFFVFFYRSMIESENLVGGIAVKLFGISSFVNPLIRTVGLGRIVLR